MSSTMSSLQLYFCHQCNRTVNISPSPSTDLSCPICYGGFLEEVDSPDPNPNSFDLPPALLLDELASIFGGSTPPSGTNRSASLSPSPSPLFQDPEAFSPFLFLQNYLQTLRAGGANIQFVIENDPSGGSGGGAFRLPGNLGDYFIGPGLEQLIQQLAENDPNRYGTPPASKSAVEGLPDTKITEDMLKSDSSQCAICKDTFEVGEEGKQMPCKHIYHKYCILPWLEMHNSCPVCRYELPTDDPDYEQRRSGGTDSASGNRQSQNAGAGTADSVDGDNPLTPNAAERRFSISLPWPFNRAVAETSNSSTGNNNRNNESNSGDGNSNSASRGNSDFRSETREEDLD